MAWQDRLREAAYTSPSRKRLTFAYEDVGRQTDKRTTAFEYPNVDGAYVQDNGHGARQYPLRCYFSGDNHDLEATAFEAAVLERGVGRLEHPLYGTFDVVPFGTITRRDDLKTAANQSVVELTFYTTLGAVYPASQAEPRSEILAALGTAPGGFSAAASEEFAATTRLTDASLRQRMKATLQNLLVRSTATFNVVASYGSTPWQSFDQTLQGVTGSLDILVGQPVSLAGSVVGLISTPASVGATITSLLESYAALAESIFSSPAGTPDASIGDGVVLPRRLERITNDFRAADLFAMAAVSGSIQAVLATTFDAKPAAIAAASSVMSLFDRLVAWRDAGFTTLDAVDPGGAYQAMQSAVAMTVGYLVEVSFSLVPERRIKLDRPRTIIDLAAELYGSVDDKLDFLISTNDLSGSEILEIPAGRTIVYYA